ncbi:MAG: H/ACA RNA-protein complex protein Gar1 [Methanomassiliicoccales archaeon]|nr:MAG: H/ACA RNA-protein complex protein Gar1 [Methanomassiliicoccales archaeon]
MRFLGNVQEVSFDGKLIVRGSFAPQSHSRVVDNRQRPVGKVARVFGPVEAPYVTVEPTGGSSLLSAIGKQLYVEEVGTTAKTKGRDRRDRKMS